MANIRVSVSKKGTLIAMIVLVLLLGGGGGYLLWRVNQKDTVAPTDSSASGECDGYIEGCCYTKVPSEDACHAYKCGDYCFHDAQGALGENHCGSRACRTFTLTYIVEGAGTVNGEKKIEQKIFNSGIGSPVTAAPDTGHKFEKWKEDGSQNPTRKDVAEGNRTYTALFSPLTPPNPVTYTLTYNAGSGGSINGEKSQTVVQGGSGKPVTAVAKDGYTFDRWSDDPAKGATRTDSNVQASATYTANFKSTDTPGPAIKNCTGFRVSCGENNTIKVNWNVLPSPATYVVRVNKEPKGDWYNDAGGDLYRSFPVNVNSYVVENVEPGKIYGISVIAHKGTDDNAPFYPSCNMTGLGDVWNPPLYVELACQGTTPVDVPEPIIVPGGTVPDTAIFDDTKDTIIFGIVILTIGITWTWVSRLPKKAYSSIKTISKASSEYVSNVKVKKEKNIRESRRNRLERRIK